MSKQRQPLALRHLVAFGLLPLAVVGCDEYTQVPCEGKVDSTGLGACEDGTLYRPAAMTCDTMGPATSGMACTADEHCSGFVGGAVQYCLCGPDGGTCQFSLCRTNADCDDGYACAAVFPVSTMLACQTPDDECMTNDDCGDGGMCTFDGSRRYCQDCGADDCAIMVEPTGPGDPRDGLEDGAGPPPP